MRFARWSKWKETTSNEILVDWNGKLWPPSMCDFTHFSSFLNAIATDTTGEKAFFRHMHSNTKPYICIHIYSDNLHRRVSSYIISLFHLKKHGDFLFYLCFFFWLLTVFCDLWSDKKTNPKSPPNFWLQNVKK